MEHLNLQNGWSFDCEEIFEMAVKHFPTNSHFVEIGLGQGKSSGYMAVEIINSGKNIKLDCIDCFDMRDDETQDYTMAFLNNLKPIWNMLDISVIQNYSTEASKLYEDNSLDFVFIDGDHSFTAVTDDIEHWLPKLKANGLIAGHDYTQEYINSVVPAVDTFFGKEKVNVSKSSWYVWISDLDR
jgi:predicted O-methyltransferase YrrM